MTKVAVDIAVAEAKRFIKRANELQRACPKEEYSYWASKQSGALRRASMDLTRALADMRRPS